MSSGQDGANRIFCSRPFEWLDISDFTGKKGDSYLCCPSWLPVSVGNVLEDDLEELWNGPTAQRLRRSILDGSFEHCRRSRCPFLTKMGGPVRPVSKIDDPELLETIEKERVVLPHGPRAISCGYDKSCNLSCPTCRTHTIFELDEADTIEAIEGKLRGELLRDARVLHITGSGDPFGSPFFFRLLRTLDLADAPALEEIHLQTNAQLWTRRAWERIPQPIRALVRHAHVSIDAGRAETYAVNRRNGNFARLLENLEFVRELRREGPIETLIVSMVVQENNVDEIVDFVRLGRRFAADFIQFHELVNWGTFSDEEYRQRAVHLPDHPRNRELREAVRHPELQSEDVFLGKLAAV